jgi:hypothetical protein
MSDCGDGVPQSDGSLKYNCPNGDWASLGPGQSEWYYHSESNVLCHVTLRDGSAANPADPERGVCVRGSS